MVTTEQHSKVRTHEQKLQNYISYFQSVATIGIINRAITAKEAESQARLKLKNSDFMCGVVGQTPFEFHATDEWQPTTEVPDISAKNSNLIKNPYKNTGSAVPNSIVINLDGNTKECLGDKFGKDPATLTNDDYVKLVNILIEMGLE